MVRATHQPEVARGPWAHDDGEKYSKEPDTSHVTGRNALQHVF
jgi:hypothetical protein